MKCGCSYGRNQEGGGQGVYSLKPIFAELQERREDYERLREKIDGYKNLQQEVQYLSSALQVHLLYYGYYKLYLLFG